jgi:hypothetical protein
MSDIYSFLPGEVNSEEALKLIAKAEDLIQRFRDMDYVLKPEAATVVIQFKTEKKEFVLSDTLWKSIGIYEDTKSKYPSRTDQSHIVIRYAMAQLALSAIDRAWASGVVDVGQGLVRKLRECQARVVELENDLNKLSNEYQELQVNFEAYRQRVRLPDDRGDQHG